MRRYRFEKNIHERVKGSGTHYIFAEDDDAGPGVATLIGSFHISPSMIPALIDTLLELKLSTTKKKTKKPVDKGKTT